MGRGMAAALVAGMGLALAAPSVEAGTIVRFETILGNIDVELHDADAPQNVANFLNYVNRGDYVNTLFHRSVPGFVIQGGGFRLDQGALPLVSVPEDTITVFNEASLARSNVRGTIAMAQSGTDPDSATNQWFFNLVDNDGSGLNNLDTLNGGFTVFGFVRDDASLAVMDAIAALTRFDFSGGNPISPFQTVPTVDFDGSSALLPENLALISNITVPEPSLWMLALAGGLFLRREARAPTA